MRVLQLLRNFVMLGGDFKLSTEIDLNKACGVRTRYTVYRYIKDSGIPRISGIPKLSDLPSISGTPRISDIRAGNCCGT